MLHKQMFVLALLLGGCAAPAVTPIPQRGFSIQDAWHAGNNPDRFDSDLGADLDALPRSGDGPTFTPRPSDVSGPLVGLELASKVWGGDYASDSADQHPDFLWDPAGLTDKPGGQQVRHPLIPDLATTDTTTEIQVYGNGR